MTVTVCSIFRDSVGYVDRYFSHIAALGEYIDLRVVATFGDCTDGTGAALEEAAAEHGVNADIGRCDHGGPAFGSVDHPQRWDQIAKVVRHTLDRVGDPGDALVWVESDLVWPVDTMLTLLDDLDRVPSVAPLCLHGNSAFFYDTWGYRRCGVKFSRNPPYMGVFEAVADTAGGLVRIDSCGSCWATRDRWWRDWTGHWPYEAGGELWLDESVAVRHP